MKVILLQDVKKQGKKDDIIEVSDGYAKNYLIANKLAVPYTKTSGKILKKEIDERKTNEALKVDECRALKEKIEKENFSFIFNSGADGRLFGTVSTKTLAEEIKKHGYNIDKKMIKMKEKIDTLGVYNIDIELCKGVIATIKIHIC